MQKSAHFSKVGILIERGDIFLKSEHFDREGLQFSLFAYLANCSTSPLGRNQVDGLPPAQHTPATTESRRLAFYLCVP